MPKYEYVCPKDGTTKALSISLSDYDSKKLVKCPECRSKMRRDWSPPAISIK